MPKVIGQEVATPVDEEEHERRYDVTWDASALLTDVYVYRMEAGNFKEMRKLILIR